MEKPKLFYGWVIVFISFLMLLVTSGIVLSFGVFMNPLTSEFQWDRTAVSIAVSSFMLVQGLLSPFVGRLIDRYGPKIVVTLGVFILGVTLIIFGQVNSYGMFFFTYGILAAVGYSTTTLMTNSVLISKWFTEKKGLALGLSMTGFPLGPLVFSPFIGYLIVTFDWRTAAHIMGGLLIVLLLPLVVLLVKDNPENLPGKVLDAGEKAKVTFKGLIADSQYLKLAGAYFGCGFTMALISTHFPANATDLGLEPLVAATAFGIMGGFAAIGTTSAGALSDKFGRKNILSIVYFMRFTALMIFAFANTPTTLYVGAVIFGLSWTTTGPLTSALTGDIWGVKVMGTVFGFVFLSHQVGAALGAYMGGFIFDYTQSYQLAFLAGALILFISGINSFLIVEKPETPVLQRQENYQT